MNNVSNKIIGTVAALALIIGLVAYGHQPKQIVGAVGPQGAKGESVKGSVGPMGPKGEQGDRGPQGPAGRDAVATRILGSAVSSEFPGNNYSFGGLRQWSYRKQFSENASTTCTFISPAATSSVTYASFQILTNGSSTPAVIGWANGIQATTTKLSGSTDIVVAANIGGTITASSTVASFVVPPNTYINYKLGSGGGFTNNVTGSCEVIFNER